ncbi:MAG TPA: hypothetical protein DIU50_08435 [Acinetobacter nosocomialis]|nr:hypothetical protein [Acinetobacter nosocomialis]
MFFYTGRITDFRRPTHQSSLNRGLFAFMPYKLRTLDSDVLDWISSRCLNVGLFFWRFTCSE